MIRSAFRAARSSRRASSSVPFTGNSLSPSQVQPVSSRVKERGPSPESKERAVTSLSWST